MAEKEMFICAKCFREYEPVLEIEQKPKEQEGVCEFCKQKRMVRWSKITYGSKR